MHNLAPLPESTPPPMRVLLVDDSEDDAFLLQTELQRVFPNANCRRVDNGTDMARALADCQWDLVISDHSMPRFDSVAALDLVKRSGKPIPFVIYSGRLKQDAGINAMSDGASDFVHKSSPARLVAVVQRELQNAQVRRGKELAERSVVQLANYDNLTGLPNRSLFMELAEQRLLDEARPAVGGAVLYLNLDRFMRINESFGYATGDALMWHVAARLKPLVGVHGLIARFSQDKFGIFVDQIDAAGAQDFAETVMTRVAAPFAQGAQELFLTASVGVSLCPAHGSDAASLVKNAECAMFAAKKRGGNAWQVYRDELSDGSARRLRLESDLKHAVARDELFLVLQPLLDLRSGHILGVEALLRWGHPELGLIPQDEFIGIAEETRLIVEIGDWVLRTACGQMRAWHDAGFPELAIAVNVSSAQFRQADLAERVAAALAATGLPGRALELEITETVAMENAESTIETLRRLKRMGVHIAIDDFGTGYSSLSYLKRFPIDILKVDRSFVRDLPLDADSAAIVRAIAALGRSLKLLVHAEGVETPEQFNFLAAEGCDRMQGYLLAKPLDAEDALARIEQHNRRPQRSPFALPCPG